MILRRVITHFRKQEWTAIALDFLIVVAGILIAFQITEWNGARRDRAEEIRYRHDLADDLNADIAEFDERTAAAIERAAAARGVLDELGIKPVIRHAWRSDAPEELLTDSLVAESESRASTMLDLGHTRVLDGHRSTFDELVSTGKIGVLSDRDLVRVLTRYYASYESEQDGDGINRHYQLRLLDYYQEHGLAQHDDVPFETIIEMTNDPEFLGLVKTTYTFGLWQAARVSRLKREAEQVLSLLTAHEERGAR